MGWHTLEAIFPSPLIIMSDKKIIVIHNFSIMTGTDMIDKEKGFSLHVAQAEVWYLPDNVPLILQSWTQLTSFSTQGVLFYNATFKLQVTIWL